MPKTRRILFAMILVPCAVSCASVLGIESATLEKSSGSGAEAGPKTLCDEYCDTLARNCTSIPGGPKNEVYTSRDECLHVCALLDPGTMGQSSGNTVACRLHYAQSAGEVGEKNANCSIAGPGGNLVCGDNCASFCTIDAQACPGTYADEKACLTACATVPKPNLGVFDDSIQAGNSIQCRLYHVSAATIDPAFHCPHTDITKVGPCSPLVLDGG